MGLNIIDKRQEEKAKKALDIAMHTIGLAYTNHMTASRSALQLTNLYLAYELHRAGNDVEHMQPREYAKRYKAMVQHWSKEEVNLFYNRLKYENDQITHRSRERYSRDQVGRITKYKVNNYQKLQDLLLRFSWCRHYAVTGFLKNPHVDLSDANLIAIEEVTNGEILHQASSCIEDALLKYKQIKKIQQPKVNRVAKSLIRGKRTPYQQLIRRVEKIRSSR